MRPPQKTRTATPPGGGCSLYTRSSRTGYSIQNCPWRENIYKTWSTSVRTETQNPKKPCTIIKENTKCLNASDTNQVDIIKNADRAASNSYHESPASSAINNTGVKNPVQPPENLFAITTFNTHVLSRYLKYQGVKKNSSCRTPGFLVMNMPSKITNYFHYK